MILAFALITLQSYHYGTAEIMQPTEYVSTSNNFFEILHKIPIKINLQTLFIYFFIYHQSLIK